MKWQFSQWMPLAVTLLTILAGVLTFSLNESSKRVYEEYKRKEDRYVQLVKSIRGFYEETLNNDLRMNFLDQLNLCWLYCSDDVIRKAYKFLFTMHTDNAGKFTREDKEKALAELVLTIRKDLISRKTLNKTTLKPEDFKHYRPN